MALILLHGKRISIPQPGIKPGSPEVEAWSSNHWTAGGFPWYFVLAALAN